MNRVLLIGLAPKAVDLSDAPIDLDTLKERIAVGNAQVLDAGYDARFCEIDTDVARASEQAHEALRRAADSIGCERPLAFEQ
ncbi:hypothetical protein [Nocardioides sp. NPDC006273]|uniref:hypothetical protein n=1 Tax=Nocardioides sp. NPDC006273 TaxID=3155598 RepID=UPI00339F32E8